MTRLSVCTIAFDEEPFLGDWLKHLEFLADEIVLGVDSRTTDHTRELARSFGARTFDFTWRDSFAEARNLTLERARGDWILVLDPDERLTPEGQHAVRWALASNSDLVVDGFTPLFAEVDADGAVTSQEWVTGRLFLNSPHVRYVGRIHEEPRYLPNPERTWFEHLPGETPHIHHLGGTPDVRAGKAKDTRDLRLLRLRLEDDPNDAVALFYLWQMTGEVEYARRALACGPRTLHPERRAELEKIEQAENISSSHAANHAATR